jgi:uncharacterized protein (TIGR02246 family)
MRRIRLAVILMGSALLAGGAVYTPATAAPPPTIGCQHEQAQIRAVPAGVVNGWAQESGTAVAAQFTADADFISGNGEYVHGSADIAPYFDAQFAPGGFLDNTRVTAVVNKVVCLDWNTARIITLGGILFPGETEVQPDWRGIQSWVVVRHLGGVWKAQLFHNSRTLLTELPPDS